MHRLQWAQEKQEFITGLVYYDPSRPSLAETVRLGKTPLNALEEERVRPPAAALAGLMSGLM
jgi:2-oxoglutarate ferredoxin oxidoreductase subunit beta